MAQTLYQISQREQNGAWSSPEQLGTVIGSQIVTGTNEDGRIEVMFIGSDGVIRDFRQKVGGPPNGSFSPIANMGWSATKLVMGRNQDTRLEVFFTDLANNIYHAWQKAPNSGEWPQAVFGGKAQQLALANSNSGRLDLFYVGMDNNIYHHWQAAPNSPTWQGGAFQGAAKQISLIRNADGRLELFYIGMDNGLYHVWQVSPNSDSWAGGIPPATAAGLGGFGKSLTTAIHRDGRLEVFYVGGNDAIYHNWQTSQNGPWHGETAFGGSAQHLCLCQDQDGRLELFYIGMDGNVYHNWQQNLADTVWTGGAAGFLASALGSVTSVVSFELIVVFFMGYTAAPAGTVATPTRGNVGSSNYLMANNCNFLNGLGVTIEITQDVVCVANGPQQKGATYHAGFSFQFNCYSPAPWGDVWQQYVIGIVDGQIYGIINNWANVTTPLINTKIGLGAAPDGKLLAGWVLGILLSNDIDGNIVAAQFVSKNQHGVEAVQSLLVNDPLINRPSIIAPITAFELNVVGPNNSESATFSTGAGKILYSSKAALSPLVTLPPCVGAGNGIVTAETSNAVYGGLPVAPSNLFTQTFSVSNVAPAAIISGPFRPPLTIPGL